MAYASKSPVVDYRGEFPHAILAQGKGNDFLALFRLNEALYQNGKKAHYELLHRWLREPCVDEDDQSWSLVMGTERTYLPSIDVEPLLQRLKREEVEIFDHFNVS